MLLIIIGTKNGEIISGPFSASFIVSRIVELIPPMPEPTYTPKRFRSRESVSIPLCSTACLAAPMAYCMNRSDLRISCMAP